MTVNGMPFLVTVARNLKFSTAEFITSKNINHICNCFESAIELHNSRGFTIAHLLGDPEFDPMKNELKEDFDIECNGVAAQEHIPEMERHIRALKE